MVTSAVCKYPCSYLLMRKSTAEVFERALTFFFLCLGSLSARLAQIFYYCADFENSLNCERKKSTARGYIERWRNVHKYTGPMKLFKYMLWKVVRTKLVGTRSKQTNKQEKRYMRVKGTLKGLLKVLFFSYLIYFNYRQPFLAPNVFFRAYFGCWSYLVVIGTIFFSLGI